MGVGRKCDAGCCDFCRYVDVIVMDDMVDGRTFFILVLLMVCYCAAGSVYKARKYGASGAEVIPHIDCIRKTVVTVRNCVWAPISSFFPSHEYTKYNPRGNFGTEEVDVDMTTNRLMRDDYEEDVKL